VTTTCRIEGRLHAEILKLRRRRCSTSFHWKRQTVTISASLDFVPAGLALKRLQFIFAAVDRVWRSPDHMGHSAARQASRPHISAKSDIRKAHPATLTNPN